MNIHGHLTGSPYTFLGIRKGAGTTSEDVKDLDDGSWFVSSSCVFVTENCSTPTFGISTCSGSSFFLKTVF